VSPKVTEGAAPQIDIFESEAGFRGQAISSERVVL
jgi:hypothetical protein